MLRGRERECAVAATSRESSGRVDGVVTRPRRAQVDLSGILPPTVVMVVSVTGSTTSGQPLTESELGECLRGCDACLKLEDDKGTILQYLQSRMSMLAPNLTHLVGPSLAALLVGMAGGLSDLARVPACNMTVMGQEKRYLGGFGMVAGMPHTGSCISAIWSSRRLRHYEKDVSN